MRIISALWVVDRHAPQQRQSIASAAGEKALRALTQLRADALVIGPEVFFNTLIEHLGTLPLRHGVPTIYQYRPFVAAGGLISCGTDETEYYHLVGICFGKILAGEKPTNLPAMQSTKVQLILNLKTAKTLGIITVPLSLFGRADETIE
jgi:putative ABC transport system substrate-binding protein